MSQSTRNHARRGSGTVTVIEAKVHRNSARNARVGFILTASFIGALSMLVASARMQPILSLLVGMFIGTVAGAIVWAAIRIWPVARIIWWWTGELLATTATVYSWMLLNHTPLPARAVVVALVAAAFVLPGVRRMVAAVGWCFIVRHRLRTCFSQFIVANQSGSLPLIFVARPTPVGERVWIYLRPGLSLSDLASRLEKIAVACHASTVLVERASTRTAGFVRVDIKRREVLGALIGSPLTHDTDVQDDVSVGLVDDDAPVSPAPAGIPSSHGPMDLPEVTAPAPAAPAAPAARFVSTPSPAPVKKVPATVSGSEDYSDWID